MPRYNGLISYVVEVAAQLVWCYVVFAATFFVFFGVIHALFGAGVGGFVLIAVLSASNPAKTLAIVHMLTMAHFIFNFVPRFPYAPAMLTFALATVFGSFLIALAWAMQHFSGELSSDGIAQWIGVERDAIEQWFYGPILVSLLSGLCGLVVYRYQLFWAVLLGRWSPGRWLGWLTVGREAYDAFLAREEARIDGSRASHSEGSLS